MRGNVARFLVRDIICLIIPPLRALKDRISILQNIIYKKDEQINLLMKERERALLSGSGQIDKKIIQHGNSNGTSEFNFSEFASQHIADFSTQLKIIQRIAEALSKELNSSQMPDTSKTDLWTTITENHAEIVSILSEDASKAIDYLEKMFTTPLTNGFQQGEYMYNLLCSNQSWQKHCNQMQMDKLCGLAEAVGAVPVENPEQGDWGVLMASNPDKLLDLIEKSINFEIHAPIFQAGLYGLHTTRGIFTVREFFAILIAKTISELIADKNIPICEIGGGGGSLAYYCWQFGFRNITVIDLPTVNIAQSYWLSRNLPKSRMYFSGDEGIFDKTAGIRVLPPRYFELAPDKHYGLVVNVDSFPEITCGIVQNYLGQIKRNAELFLSINQEAAAYAEQAKQLIVHEQVKLVGGFRRRSRYPFWLRKGYVEEVYEVA